MKRFSEMKFYTTAEIADKLGMNIQVIARKLQAGEIEGYKIGKDWRIEEDAVQRWLQKIANPAILGTRDKVIKNFIKNDRIIRLPAQRKKRIYVLQYVLEQFDKYRVYKESEVDEIIRRYYDDHCTFRRLLVDEKMMIRKTGNYRRNGSYRFIC